MDDHDEYLARLPEETRAVLQDLRKSILNVVPEAVETISYRMPAFKYRGRPVAAYAAHTNHCSFHPMSGDVVDALRDELSGYETSKGTVHFTVDKPLPAPLVKKLVTARIAEIDGRS